MSETMFVALLSLLGTLLGSLAGILAANKLVNYRLKQLEKKVELHNNAVERLYKAEGALQEVQHEINDLKAYRKP